MITQRQNDILNLIVDIFTQTREPVGSKALQGSIKSSSATIRNDMASLEKLGLLEKAHTSSGRLPSQDGFRYFVEHCLTMDQMDERDVYPVIKAFDKEFFKLEDILFQAAHTLSSLTGYTTVVLDVEPSRQTLTSFELVKFSHHDALAVLTLDGTTPVTVQFAIPKNFLDSDLTSLKTIVLERFVGQSVLAIHYRLRTEIPQIIQRYFKRTENVLDLFDHIFSAMFEEKLILAGKGNVLEFAGLETYQFLENKQSLALEIRNSLGQLDDKRIQIADSRESSLSELTVIHQKFIIPYRGEGILTVVGPVELDYRRVLSLMYIIAQVLTAKLGDFYRYLSSNHYEVN